MDEIAFDRPAGFYMLPSNLWELLPGGEVVQANYTETEAQRVAEKFPSHILFLCNEVDPKG